MLNSVLYRVLTLKKAVPTAALGLEILIFSENCLNPLWIRTFVLLLEGFHMSMIFLDKSPRISVELDRYVFIGRGLSYVNDLFR